MLRITLHHDHTQCCLELAGKLGGPEVAETETVWRSNTCRGKRIEVDLKKVTSVDDAGRKLLEAMHSAGAHFIAEGVWMTALLEEIIGE